MKTLKKYNSMDFIKETFKTRREKAALVLTLIGWASCFVNIFLVHSEPLGLILIFFSVLTFVPTHLVLRRHSRRLDAELLDLKIEMKVMEKLIQIVDPEEYKRLQDKKAVKEILEK